MHGVRISNNDLINKPVLKQKAVKSLPRYVVFIIEQLLDLILSYDKHVALCENQLNKLLPESHPQIKILISVPGIGIVLARTIFSEILDITYFKEPKYLISYSGIAPMMNESEGRKGPIKLNSYCNYFLKYAFVEAAHNASDHIKYRRKYELDVKKHGKTIAKLNLARRLVKTIYWMLIRQQLYKM
jgi:transposase